MPRLYDEKFEGGYRDVEHINGYLLPGPEIYVESRSKPLCPVPPMSTGNMPADGGNLIIEAKDYEEFIRREPRAKKYIRRLIGSEEFIHNKPRYCLWLVDCPPEEIRRMKPVYERVKKCKEDRLKGGLDKIKLSDTPHLFRETKNPKSAIIIPAVSSERRKYVPIDFVDDSAIYTNLVLMIPDAELWHFGILTSSVHMAWMRLVCGRLESRYRYSAKVVYNNFAWMQMPIDQYATLNRTAQGILDARKKYPDASLADLYDEVTMPKILRDAHKKNDRAVMDIYGYDYDMTEEEIQVDLLYRYQFIVDYLAGKYGNIKPYVDYSDFDDEDDEED